MLAGALRSTAVTPLRRYYGPLRLPAEPSDSLCIPSRRVGYDPLLAGSLRFLTLLSERAAPLYPGEPSDYWPMADRLALIHSSPVLASPSLAGWPLPS